MGKNVIGMKGEERDNRGRYVIGKEGITLEKLRDEMV